MVISQYKFPEILYSILNVHMKGQQKVQSIAVGLWWPLMAASFGPIASSTTEGGNMTTAPSAMQKEVVTTVVTATVAVVAH